MRKELITTANSEDAAIAKLRSAFADYRRKRDVKDWHWIKEPEALQAGRIWRAYGRIEFTK